MSKKRIAIIFVVGVALAIVGVVLFGQGGQTVLAADPDGVITGLDMDPSGNTATSLGTIDRCRVVSAGDVIDIDVWVDDLETDSILYSKYDLGGWPASGIPGTDPQITGQDVSLFLDAAPGSSAMDLGDGVPDATDPHAVNVVDIFGVAEYNPPYIQGVIARHTLDTTNAVPGLYHLTLSTVVHQRDTPPGGYLTNQAIYDSNYTDTGGTYGLLAIDRPCPGTIVAPPVTYEKVSMPDFGQHSQGWCWVGAAANSFWYYAKTVDFDGDTNPDYPGLVPAGYEYIEAESRNATGADNNDPHDFDGDTIKNEADGIPDWFDYTDRPEDPQTTGNVYDGTCGDYIDNDVPADGTVDLKGLIGPPPFPPDPDCTNFAPGGLGDDDGDTLVDEDPINVSVDEDGDSTTDEDAIDGIDNDGDYAPNPFGVCPGPGNPGCDEDPPAYDDDGDAPANADEDGVVGYRTLLKKIAETMWHDTNEDGIDDGPNGPNGIAGDADDEPGYVYSEPVEKWDYLCGLQKYIDNHGVALQVHDILSPNFRFRGMTPDTDDNHGASMKDRPGLLTPAVQLACGVNQIVKTPTFNDYKRELSRSQDVLVWMCAQNQFSEWYCHVVTGQAYDNTAGAGAHGNGTLTVADPWSHAATPPHDDSWGQASGPDHNNNWKHPDPEPYDTCDVVTPGKDDASENFDIDCNGTVWTVADLIFVSPPGPDIKVIDWRTSPPGPVNLTVGGPYSILVEEDKHNNGPMDAWSSATWKAEPSDPIGLNVRWVAQTNDGCTVDGVPVDCVTTPFINDLEFEVDLPQSVTTSLSRYLELEAYQPGQYTVTLTNEQWPFNPGGNGPGTDPIPDNNDATTTLYVNVDQPAGTVDKEVLDIVFDDADAYPLEGADIGNELTILKSENVPFSVTSVDINNGPEVPSDAEISFYAIVPQGCSGRWYDPAAAFPFDIQTLDGDINVGSSGTPFFPPEKEPGPVTLDLHFQTAEYESAGYPDYDEPVGVPRRYIRFFEIHCYGPGTTADDDGDTLIDEDPVDGIDNDSDGNEDGTFAGPGLGNCNDGMENDPVPDGIDAADPDCAPFIDEDPPAYIFTFCNRADVKFDTDPEPLNNLFCEDLYVNSLHNADIKILDWTAPTPNIGDMGIPFVIPVDETKHNNGPQGAFSDVTWTANSDPELNVRWIAAPGDTCTLGGVPVNCATAPTIDDLEFQVDLTAVSTQLLLTRDLEITCNVGDGGTYQVTLINDESPVDPNPPHDPWIDPDPLNNSATTIIDVICNADLSNVHYKCYDIPLEPPVPPVSVNLETQFGHETGVPVIDSRYLCPPASKNAEPYDPDGTHLKLYSITSSEDPDVVVNLTDQFGTLTNVEVGQALYLATPALKAIAPAVPQGPAPEDPHYKCYGIPTVHSYPGLTVNLDTQFGSETDVGVGSLWYLCAPAGKNGAPIPPDAPHLACYGIATDDPTHVVNLETQFGPESNVGVGDYSGDQGFLCVPTVKEIVAPPIGGIAEYPDVGGSAQGPADSSGGSSSLPYAALAGGLAVAVAMTAGVWYTRRWWLRLR